MQFIPSVSLWPPNSLIRYGNSTQSVTTILEAEDSIRVGFALPLKQTIDEFNFSPLLESITLADLRRFSMPHSSLDPLSGLLSLPLNGDRSFTIADSAPTGDSHYYHRY